MADGQRGFAGKFTADEQPGRKPDEPPPGFEDRVGPQQGEPVSPLELGEWDAGDDVDPPPPRGWLLGNSFCRCFLSSVIAEGGTGKTTYRYAQYLSLATGRSLTGEQVFLRCRVLVISLEDNADELRRRILACCLYYGIKPADLKGWLFLAAPRASIGKLLTIDKEGDAETGPLAEALERAIVRRKIDLAALDPFVKTHGQPENDNSKIDQVAGILTDLADKYDMAVDVPHHVRKSAPDPGNADRGRGASAQRDASRLYYSLTVMTTAEADMFSIPEDERRLYFRVDPAKVNIAEAASKAKWFKLIIVNLGNGTEIYPSGDSVPTIAVWKPPGAFEGLDVDAVDRIVDTISTGLADGERYSGESAAKMRHAWRVVKLHASDKSEPQCREVIKQWMKTGLLINEPYYSKERRETVTGLRVDDSKRPSKARENWNDD